MRSRTIIVGGLIALQLAGLAAAIMTGTRWTALAYLGTALWAALWWDASRQVDRYRAWLHESYERERILIARLRDERWNSGSDVAGSHIDHLEPPV